jgi:hypothetical protein
VLRLGPLKIPWLGKDSREDDPYWDFFINTPPADLANTVTEMIRSAPEGNVFPTKAELHTPDITSSHVKELARYLGTDLVGIARLTTTPASITRGGDGRGEGNEHYPFAVICAVQADYDPRHALGIGGQVPVQKGLFITFVLSAWIRELGLTPQRHWIPMPSSWPRPRPRKPHRGRKAADAPIWYLDSCRKRDSHRFAAGAGRITGVVQNVPIVQTVQNVLNGLNVLNPI